MRNKRSAGKCIFDGNAGVTKAHIFPEWLNELITERTDRHLRAVGFTETFVPGTAVPERWSKVSQGDSSTRKVRKVCGSCNSGWLGGLETPAKPHVVSLMNGEDVVIDAAMQQTLAAWLCAITMLLDADHSAGPAVPQSEREYFKRNRVPPPNWRVWIARYQGVNWQNHRVRRIALNVQSSPDVIGDRQVFNTQVTTLVIRQLGAHVYSSTVMDLPGYEGISMFQLWPLTGETFVWRRSTLLDDASVIALSEALAADLKPLP